MHRVVGWSRARGDIRAARWWKRIGLRRTLIGALAALALMYAAPGAMADESDLIVDGPTQGWVSAAPTDIGVFYEADDSTTDLTLDVNIDGTAIRHWQCGCTLIGTDGDRFPFQTPETVATWDPAAVADGSTHTFQVVVTKHPSEAQVASQTWSFTVDKTPPEAEQPEGDVRWSTAGGYINAAAGHELLLTGYDELSGVAEVKWEEIGGGHWTGLQDNDCWDSPVCDPDEEYDADISTATLGPGAHLLREVVLDRAGNWTYADPWTINVDGAGPAAPTGIAAARDPADGQAYILWQDGGDPALPDGTPGSGTIGFSYRYSVNGGAWTAWTDTSDAYGALGALAAGASVAVEVKAVDAVQNSGPTATATVTVTDADPNGPLVDIIPESADEDSSAPARAAGPPAAPPGSVKCLWSGFDTTDDEPRVVDYKGEPLIRILATIKVFCKAKYKDDPEGAANALEREVSLHVCVDVEDPLAFNGWRQLSCDSGGPRAGTTSEDKLTVDAGALCLPGTRRYRVHGTVVAIGKEFPPVILHQINGDPEHPTGDLSAQPHACNEAGVWRRIAYADPGTPSGLLGAHLQAPGSPDPLPPGLGGSGTHGYAAHHIIPAGEGKGAEGSNTEPKVLAQRYGYDCGVEPNSAANGVWLRGPNLDPDDPGWNQLSTDEKNRASHKSKGVGVHSHNAAYYGYLADNLGAIVNDSTDVCTGNAFTILNYVRGQLKDGNIPGVN